MTTSRPPGNWTDSDQVEWYLERVGKMDARLAGESMLTEVLPPTPKRLLDLGCGDGRLTALILDARPSIEAGVAIDCSPPMLERARQQFAGDRRVCVRDWDLRHPITTLGDFDLIVSGFAIHHLENARKHTLLQEVVSHLVRPGAFLNLEVIASATPERHAEFLAAIGRETDDPEDHLASIEDQLAWMQEAGMTNVDCLWRWRGFALLAGEVK